MQRVGVQVVGCAKGGCARGGCARGWVCKGLTCSPPPACLGRVCAGAARGRGCGRRCGCAPGPTVAPGGPWEPPGARPPWVFPGAPSAAGAGLGGGGIEGGAIAPTRPHPLAVYGWGGPGGPQPSPAGTRGRHGSGHRATAPLKANICPRPVAEAPLVFVRRVFAALTAPRAAPRGDPAALGGGAPASLPGAAAMHGHSRGTVTAPGAETRPGGAESVLRTRVCTPRAHPPPHAPPALHKHAATCTDAHPQGDTHAAPPSGHHTKGATLALPDCSILGGLG